ncbi:MAG: DUF1294 domain-containing protein [Planctomycetota bacterium]
MDPSTFFFGVAILYAVMSSITLVVFGLDKRAARRDRWRTPEKTLISLALCGGWPGAMLAMRLFRHKTRKPLFRFGIPTIGLLHGAAIGYVAWLLLSG